MKTKLFLTGLAFIAVTSIASGQNTETENKQVNTPGKGVAYVDENKNGVCDNFEKRSGKTQATPGTCYYRAGKGNGNGPANCCGRGPYKGQGKGKGRNFVDKNNDGICDLSRTKTDKMMSE